MAQKVKQETMHISLEFSNIIRLFENKIQQLLVGKDEKVYLSMIKEEVITSINKLRKDLNAALMNTIARNEHEHSPKENINKPHKDLDSVLMNSVAGNGHNSNENNKCCKTTFKYNDVTNTYHRPIKKRKSLNFVSEQTGRNKEKNFDQEINEQRKKKSKEERNGNREKVIYIMQPPYPYSPAWGINPHARVSYSYLPPHYPSQDLMHCQYSHFFSSGSQSPEQMPCCRCFETSEVKSKKFLEKMEKDILKDNHKALLDEVSELSEASESENDISFLHSVSSLGNNHVSFSSNESKLLPKTIVKAATEKDVSTEEVMTTDKARYNESKEILLNEGNKSDEIKHEHKEVTSDEERIMAIREEKRLRKNQRSRERAAEQKKEIMRIISLPEEGRSKSDLILLEKVNNTKKRKKELERIRRKRRRDAFESASQKT